MNQLLLVLIFLVGNFPKEEVIPQIRTLFYEASRSAELALKFHKKMQELNTHSPIITAYKGMAEMMLAHHALNPWEKLTYFRKGKGLLEESIRLSPQNPELRYLRFTVQTTVPSILGYKSEIDADKAIILANLKSLKDLKKDNDLIEKMRTFMLSSSYCTGEEKKMIQNE